MLLYVVGKDFVKSSQRVGSTYL